MYHALLVVGLCVAYAIFAYFFAWFFKAGPVRLSMRSAVLVALAAVIGNALSTTVPDWQLANRVLHIFAGGVPAYLACILAARDAGVAAGRVRVILASALLVTALGAANEHVELALQYYWQVRFAAGPLDTWFDLVSNTTGLVLAAIALWPFTPGPFTPASTEKA